MELKEEIEVFNYIGGLTEEYKINHIEEITKDNIHPISNIEADGKIITDSFLRNDFIIMSSFKVKNEIDLNNPNVKEISLIGFSITLIKNNKNQEISINIPIKEEKSILKKNFYNQNFFFYDFITINEEKNYLIIYIFSQLHIFKVYQKDENLKYIKIKLKNFENRNKKFKLMYLGSNLEKNKNILEIGLILKPENNFLFVPIDITDKNSKLEEKEYKIDIEKYKTILSKFKRSYTDKFIFIEKETNKSYILSKDESNNEITVKELETHIWENKNVSGKEFSYLYNIDGNTYLISEIPKEEENEDNYLNIGIFNVFYNKEIDKYNLKLFQKVKIKNDGGYKEFKFNLTNCLSVNIGEKLFFIQLAQNGCVSMINRFQLNSNNLEISRQNYEKWNEKSSFIFYIQNKIYFSNFGDNFEKLGKCYIEYKNEEIIEPKNDDKENENEKDIENIKVHKKENKKKKKKKEEQIIIEKNIINSKDDNEIKIIIEEIINRKIEKHKKRIEKLKTENEERFNNIKKDIKKQKEENKRLEQKCSELLKRLQKLNEIKNKCQEENEEEENEMNINFKSYSINNNYKNNYHDYKNSQSQNNRINMSNNSQILNFRQVNPQQQLMNQYNYSNNNQNLLYNNNHLNLNDPRIIQFLQHQQYQRNMMMGNAFLNK